jgi:adenylate cyclase
MGKKYKRRAIDKIRFSIGAKLITIISIIVILSLGSITALVSWLVREDLRISAEDSNFEANRRATMDAETAIISIRSNSRVLIRTISAAGLGTALAGEDVNFFFNENTQTAVVFFLVPGTEEQFYINKGFFSSYGINEDLVVPFFNGSRNVLAQAARGETLIVNAAPHFLRPCLALFYPYGGGVVGVLFSSDTLNSNFGYGTNKSYMINNSGDILAHSDFSLVRSGTNIKNTDFIRAILDSKERSKQELTEVDIDFFQMAESPLGAGILSVMWEDIKVRIKPATDFLAEKILFVLDRTSGRIAAPAADNKTAAPSGEKKKIRQFVAYTKLNAAGVTVITSIEYDKVFEGIVATTRRNILLTIAVLCISIIFIWIFSKSISVPLKYLAQAARHIEGGQFDIELATKGKDEIGVLSSSFQKMCSALRIFGRFTNKDIAIQAMRGQIKPGGLPKHGTVFFSDIREFTAKSEHFTKVFGEDASDKIVFWLNSYFTQMVDCVEKTNGVVDKFIGDAVMAHWGTAYSAGSPRKDAFNCVKAALMMRKALYFMNKERRTGDPANPPIRIGCGINSGIVTAGQLGSEKRMEYTVIGDPVNLASRIEALTKPLGADILISEDTWRLVGDLFVTEEMPPVTVKGKEKPVRIFAVINFSGEEKGPQSIDDVRGLLGIEAPVLELVDVNADEKKYKIGTE